MKFLNPHIHDDLENGRPINLNLGSGGSRMDGYYGVDHLPLDGVDILADLNQPLDLLPDDSVSQVYTRHTLEHVDGYMDLMRELHRVVSASGRLQIIVPHFSNPYYYSDPTHVRPFGLYSMFYFADPIDQPRRKVPAFYTPFRFKVHSVRIKFYRRGVLDYALHPLMTVLVNQSYWWQDLYERRLCRLVHASEIIYEMSPVVKRP